MERYETFGASDLDNGDADRDLGYQRYAWQRYPVRCDHEHVTVEDFDFGVCEQTGYHDCGTDITCLDCGLVFTPEEFQAELTKIDAEHSRKPVVSEPFTVGPEREVA